jgi:hypothetical protein
MTKIKRNQKNEEFLFLTLKFADSNFFWQISNLIFITVNMNTDKECLLCQSDARVPAQIICFPCNRSIDGEPGCNAAKRYCTPCIREFLQLNIPKEQRAFVKKCLFCPSKVNPRYLGSSEHVYCKDYYTMAQDTKTDYPCFNDGKGCTFKGSQNELDRHMKRVCIYRTSSCKCKKFFIAKDEAEHRQDCPYFKKCSQCQEAIPIDKFTDHLFEQHSLVKCAHAECEHLSTTNKHQEHMNKQCKFRHVVCKQCSCLTRAIDLGNHVLNHIRGEQSDIQELAKKMMACRQRLDECMDFYTEIMKE